MSAPVDQNDTADDAALEDASSETEATERGAESAAKDWEAEFKAQQKINRDLERRSKARMRELEAEVAAAKAPKPADDEKPDIDAIREQIRKETQTESLKERALDKLEAKAARKFQNPEDARAFLAANVEDFVADGKVDVQAISDALEDLLEQRPYLGVTQGEPKRFQGTGDQGPKGSAGKPPQLTKADLERMTREGDYDGITEAKKLGRFNELLGIKP